MKVVYKIADNIISSLGITTAENVAAINQGQSGITSHCNEYKIPELFQASVVNFERLDSYFRTFASESRYTNFERMLISSVYEASAHANVDLASPETLFVISTTKGNVVLLEPENENKYNHGRVNLWASADEILSFFRNPNSPVIVSQACISGVSALLVAKMYLESGKFKNAVVSGGDVLSKFIVSGFQSFKALSPSTINCLSTI